MAPSGKCQRADWPGHKTNSSALVYPQAFSLTRETDSLNNKYFILLLNGLKLFYIAYY